jgi:hypothetical protein
MKPMQEIKDDEPITPAHLLAVRSDGLEFSTCCQLSAAAPSLVKEFDRLWGTNLLSRGTAIDLAIDEATGRQHSDCGKFIRFVWNYVFIRCPQHVAAS